MLRGVDRWFAGYLASRLRRPRRVEGVRHLMFCVADHFEPLELFVRAGGPNAPEEHVGSREQRLALVREWRAQYPKAVSGFFDADGQTPRHTFFISPDDHEPGWVGDVAALCADGFGEIELHLHHRNDTAERLGDKLAQFRDMLRRDHGMLGSWREGARRQGAAGGENRDSSDIRHPSSGIPHSTLDTRHSSIAYGFIHGNWALCNARPDGDWCGVNEELAVLAETGCYADFTFPSAPSPTQPRMVNAIYRAWDKPAGRGQDAGVRCRVSGVRGQDPEFRAQGSGNTEPTTLPHSHAPTLPYAHTLSSSLMLIQGPLGLDWSRRKWGMLPRLENAGIAHRNPPTPERVDLWVRQGIHVEGRPEWVFVKVHVHGAIPSSAGVVLGDPMRRAHEHLQRRYKDGQRWQLHYVTAREMYNIVRAAEEGMHGDPGLYRDYEVDPPPASGLTPA